ncbi:MAG: cytochrome c [Saprospiraceae bacterium]|nr:cytochrome c [Saprospiraceae bacterium]
MKKTVCLIALFFLFLFSCNNLQNPYKEGKYSYEKHCADCHGVQGEGLGKLYPSLKSKEFIEERRLDIACLLRLGIKNDSLAMFRTKYGDQEMPENKWLSESDICNILNYINQMLWHKEPFTLNQISEQLKKCKN